MAKGCWLFKQAAVPARIINASQIDLPLDIDHVSASGGRLGCGTILVIDDTNCIVDIVRNNLDFFRSRILRAMHPLPRGRHPAV